MLNCITACETMPDAIPTPDRRKHHVFHEPFLIYPGGNIRIINPCFMQVIADQSGRSGFRLPLHGAQGSARCAPGSRVGPNKETHPERLIPR